MVEERMNRKTQVQGPAPEETPSTPLVATMTNESQVNRADVERKAQQLLGPQIMGSDHWWNCLALSAAKYWELSPLRERIQKLALKYRDNPAAFQRKVTGLRKAHHRKLARDPSQKEQVAWYNELQRRVDERSAAMLPTHTKNPGSERMGGLPTLPEDLTYPKLQAINWLLGVFEVLVTGRPPAETDLKKLIDALETLAARPTGRPKVELNREAFKLVRSRKYANKDREYHYICLEIDPLYSGMSGEEQGRTRRARREGVRRLQAVQGKKKRAEAKQRHETP